QQYAIPLDQPEARGRSLTHGGAAVVADNGARSVPAAPSGDAGAQAEFGIVAIREEVFVEPADLVEHFPAIHGSASIGPEHLFFAIELALVERAGTAAAILAVGKN